MEYNLQHSAFDIDFVFLRDILEVYQMAWVVESTEDFERQLNRYNKKHRQVLMAVLDNLDTYFETLKSGVKAQNVVFGFVHPEPNGVRAIDQRGGRGRLPETRLYVYPDEETKVLHLITLGDKRSQHDDIQACKRFIADLRKENEQRKDKDRNSDG
jgi:hypothetical protein